MEGDYLFPFTTCGLHGMYFILASFFLFLFPSDGNSNDGQQIDRLRLAVA